MRRPTCSLGICSTAAGISRKVFLPRPRSLSLRPYPDKLFAALGSSDSPYAVDEAEVERQLKDGCGSFLRMSLQLALRESSNDIDGLSHWFVFNKFPYRNFRRSTAPQIL